MIYSEMENDLYLQKLADEAYKWGEEKVEGKDEDEDRHEK